MGDVNALMRQRLTPEQQAMLDRDKINESLGPFDFMPGGLTGIYGAGGALFGALAPGGIRSIPKMAAQNRRWGDGGVSEAIRDGVAQTAVIGGGAGTIGYVHEILKRMLDRHDIEQQMMLGNPRDAEGQSGGFYGQPLNTLMRR